jgi:hypothetical protein
MIYLDQGNDRIRAALAGLQSGRIGVQPGLRANGA